MEEYPQEVSRNQEINARERDLLAEVEIDLRGVVDNLDAITIINRDLRKRQIIYRLQQPNHTAVIVKLGELFSRQEFNEVTHESFIGLFGTNRLSSPHFAKVIGTMVTDTCPEWMYEDAPADNCASVMYEYIAGPTLQEYLDRCSVMDLKRILWQIFQALHFASVRIDFTHYDLHLENVIIRDGIPVLIDYGVAHMKYLGHDYGRMMKMGNIQNRGMWYHDVFKLLMLIYTQVDPEIVRFRLIDHVSTLIEDLANDIYYRIEPHIHDEDYIASRIADESPMEQGRIRDKIEQKNIRYYRMIDKYQAKIDALEATRQELESEDLLTITSTQPDVEHALMILSRLYPIAPVITALLRFFVPIDQDWYRTYIQKYRYNQPTDTMTETPYNFHTFLSYAQQVLGG